MPSHVEPHQMRFSRTTAALHWASAGLVLCLLAVGLSSSRVADGAASLVLLRLHVLLGWLVLALTMVRVMWRRVGERPPAPSLPPGRLVAYHLVHGLLLTLLAALSLSGAATLLASGMLPVPWTVDPTAVDPLLSQRKTHSVLAVVFGALLVVHLVGVLTHRPRESFRRMRVLR